MKSDMEFINGIYKKAEELKKTEDKAVKDSNTMVINISRITGKFKAVIAAAVVVIVVFASVVGLKVSKTNNNSENNDRNQSERIQTYNLNNNNNSDFARINMPNSISVNSNLVDIGETNYYSIGYTGIVSNYYIVKLYELYDFKDNFMSFVPYSLNRMDLNVMNKLLGGKNEF